MTRDHADSFEGRMVLDRDGNKIGKVREVYLDDQSDRPKWGVVKAGRIAKRRFFPLTDVDSSGEDLKLSITKDRIDAAPEVAEGEHLSPELESRLHRHYDGGGGDGPRRGSQSDTDRDDNRSGGVGQGTMAAARASQRDQFGGFNLGAALLGWLVAGGIAAILTAIISGAGAAIGLTKVSDSTAQSNAGTISIIGAVVLLLVLAIAYYVGGYNAGRLSRFDGGRQGLGVWLVGLVITLVLGAAGALFGSQYNVLQKLDVQPRVPVHEGSFATGGLIALAAVIVITILAAILGGKAGERYHKKVDRAAYGG